jgi:hypothetical protein
MVEFTVLNLLDYFHKFPNPGIPPLGSRQWNTNDGPMAPTPAVENEARQRQ